jgi:hypothetical protein
VRALETLARQPMQDTTSAQQLLELYARTRLAPVQRAIAEIFLRNAPAEAPANVGTVLRTHRLRDNEAPNVIDAALARFRG